jgi:hypothetical protein
VCSALTLLSICLYWNFRFVPFDIVTLVNEEYVISKDNYLPLFNNNLKTVLRYYDEDFTEQNGLVYIRYSLYRNNELIYNYTKKANDSAWLSTR